MADPYSELIAAYISSKGGSDFSSNSVDPVMQYLLGNYQSAPQFTQDDLYNKFAPNIRAANNSLNPAFKQAADMIKSGTPSWELWTNKDLIKSSGLKADEWKDFVESLAQDNQKVLVAMIDQSMEQDYFQKQGMPGARETYLDKNADGGLKNIGAAYKFAPEQFDALLGDLPKQQAADMARYSDVDRKYGKVMVTDEAKKRELLYKKALNDYMISPRKPSNVQKVVKFLTPKFPGFEKVGQAIGLGKNDQRGNAAIKALQELKNNPGPMEDVSASQENLRYANAIKQFGDRRAGSAVDTNRRAQETALQILTSLAAQGATPLKDSILSNVMLKRSTRNG
jgi:hypothetical protein